MTTYFYKLSLKAKIEQIGHHKKEEQFPYSKKMEGGTQNDFSKNQISISEKTQIP